MSGSGRVKAGLKSTLKGVARAMGSEEPGDAARLRILTYHSVGTRDHEMNVTPEAFGAQMAWLAENYEVSSLDDAVASERGLSITFDDGYGDNLENALPVLERLGLDATVFVVPGRVGGYLDHDREVEDARLMDWGELVEAQARGLSIGGHTMNHRRLSELDASDQRREIADCRAVLEDRLGHGISAFAYPFGSARDYTRESVDLVREAGYDYAVSNRYGTNGAGTERWTLRRIWIDRSDDLDSFRAKVSGQLDALSWLDSPIGIGARRALNRVLDRS